MVVAFDGQLFLKKQKTGIAQMAYSILINMKFDVANQYVINAFTTKEKLQNSFSLSELNKLGYSIKYGGFDRRLYRLLELVVPIPYSCFFGNDSDVTIFFNYVISPSASGKNITIIHDMVYKACPETMSFKTKKVLESAMSKTVRRSDHIITDSEFSKSEIEKYLSVSEEKISVLYGGVDHEHFKPDISAEEIERIKRLYGITGSYILYLGTIEPRKNLVRLIKAYDRLKTKSSDLPKLILAGGDGWGYKEIHEIVKKRNDDSNIKFLGYVGMMNVPR